MDQESKRVVIEPTSRLDRKAERYALLLREAFAFALERGRSDAVPLAYACGLARALAEENKETDAIVSDFTKGTKAAAFWPRWGRD